MQRLGRRSCGSTARCRRRGGTRVETRRFEATVPSDGSAASIGPALNRAANEVATKVATWIGNG